MNSIEQVQIPKLLTLQEAADLLRIRYWRAAELARRGVLPAIRLGRQTRIDPVRLREFLDRGGQALPGGWRKQPRESVEAAS
jgi:excisionase family DNA binding protein